jgi:uncharacterized membrane protein
VAELSAVSAAHSRLAPAAARVRQLTIVLDVGLIVLIVVWQFDPARAVGSLLWGALLALPLLAPLPGLLRAQRRTFAWCTLCVIPCFVIGLTEAVAQPATRVWSGTCLALALTLFVALIAYLRLTRA